MMAIKPTPELARFVTDLKNVLGKHKNLKPNEMLAGASQLVGMLVALQDKTRMSPQMAMAVVTANVAEGNKLAVDTAFLFQEGATQ